MDNVTHALAGCLIAASAVALVNRRARVRTLANDSPTESRSSANAGPDIRVAAFVLAIVAAELPDSDLLYAGRSLGIAKLGYLLHHRGYTHTVVFAVAAAVVSWLLVIAIRKPLRAANARWPLLGVALAGTLSHLALDFTNTYGIHPFWPINNSWFFGDAVFIIEPLLWIAVLPPLFFDAKSRAARVFYALALTAIVILAWIVPQTGMTIAGVLTVASVLWFVATRSAKPSWRIPVAIGAFVAIESMFFIGSITSRNILRREVGATKFKDAAITPNVSNPLCFSAIVVQRDGDTYRTINATVAPFPSLVTSTGCAFGRNDRKNEQWRNSRTTASIIWEHERIAPLSELRSFVGLNCEISAAMRFVRVPVWHTLDDGSIEFADLRYSEGAGGFASIITTPAPAKCPQNVPPWNPPRADLLSLK